MAAEVFWVMEWWKADRGPEAVARCCLLHSSGKRPPASWIPGPATAPQFTKPGSLTHLTLPSVSGATVYIFAQNPLMALKSQPRPHPIEPLALGANGVHVLLFSCLPVSKLQASRYMPAFPLILGKPLLARDASSTTIQSRCFLVYRLLLCESSQTASLSSDTLANRTIPNGDITLCSSFR